MVSMYMVYGNVYGVKQFDVFLLIKKKINFKNDCLFFFFVFFFKNGKFLNTFFTLYTVPPYSKYIYIIN